MLQTRRTAIFALIITCATSMPLVATDEETFELLGETFHSWEEYVQSEEFRAAGMRCGTPEPWFFPEHEPPAEAPQDCTLWTTNPDPSYAPGPIYEVPVVVHIITHGNGVTGDITDATVQSQIDVLNEDYLAIAGTNGGDGNFTGIQFVLASEDPDGMPTTGITRTANTTWYNDQDEQGFKSTLNWDPRYYLNFYTNNTQYLGYSWFPQWGVGSWHDGIVINYRAFGRPAPMYPYNLGRTATHEVGHWIGLFHPFQDGCGLPDPPSCYSTADLICDTNPDQNDTYGCPVGATSCGGYPVPIENYMEYTDDACMTEFTPEQVLRMRCTLTSYRPLVYREVDAVIFADGFESGDWSEWSAAYP
jgi:hypothetical protein